MLLGAQFHYGVAAAVLRVDSPNDLSPGEVEGVVGSGRDGGCFPNVHLPRLSAVDPGFDIMAVIVTTGDVLDHLGAVAASAFLFPAARLAEPATEYAGTRDANASGRAVLVFQLHATVLEATRAARACEIAAFTSPGIAEREGGASADSGICGAGFTSAGALVVAADTVDAVSTGAFVCFSAGFAVGFRRTTLSTFRQVRVIEDTHVVVAALLSPSRRATLPVALASFSTAIGAAGLAGIVSNIPRLAHAGLAGCARKEAGRVTAHTGHAETAGAVEVHLAVGAEVLCLSTHAADASPAGRTNRRPALLSARGVETSLAVAAIPGDNAVPRQGAVLERGTRPAGAGMAGVAEGHFATG